MDEIANVIKKWEREKKRWHIYQKTFTLQLNNSFLSMNSENIYRFITIDEYAVTPKYVQLSNSIVKAIEQEKIGKDSGRVNI